MHSIRHLILRYSELLNIFYEHCLDFRFYFDFEWSSIIVSLRWDDLRLIKMHQIVHIVYLNRYEFISNKRLDFQIEFFEIIFKKTC